MDAWEAVFEELEPQQRDGNSVNQLETIDQYSSANVDQVALRGLIYAEVECQVDGRL